MFAGPGPYGSAFEDWRNAARETAELWRLALGLVLVVGFVLVGNIILSAMLDQFAPWLLADDAGVGSTFARMYLLLGSFALVTVGIGISCVALHRRGLGSIIGPRHRATRQFCNVLRWLCIVLSIIWVLLPIYDETLTPNLPFGLWFVWLPMGLLSVLVQTSAEELLFRGYIQQQLAARFNSPLVWSLLPSILFGLGHYAPIEAGSNAVYIAIWAGVFGMLMADLTARSGTLGPAIACHFANNVTSILLVSLSDGLNGLALYTVPHDLGGPDALSTWLPVEFGTMFVIWLAARVAIRA